MPTPEEQKVAADLTAAKKQAEADAAKATADNLGVPKVPTKRYTLKPGFTHYVKDAAGDIKQAHAGDVVELTESQFSAFSDRFIDPQADKDAAELTARDAADRVAAEEQQKRANAASPQTAGEARDKADKDAANTSAAKTGEQPKA